jgi:hypothetical protein
MEVGDVEFDIRITRKERVLNKGRSYEKLADKGNPGDGGSVYGYVTYDKEDTEETEVFRQTLKEINFADVVMVLNGITK